ncbi:NAD(P)-binding protein [Streptomyces sp. NPDC018964]|uniref:NAD(P)-binding protein n=1 Tax=Streptomyces sp. NPDC018964 TaxID=3365058 RepID=UPI0037AE2E4E
MEHVDVAVIGGGQSGLVAACALPREGLRPVVLEASGTAAGSRPRYYDSLTLFSPARYSSLPGMPFPGGPDRHPHRDEVAACLTSHAARPEADIRTGSPASSAATPAPPATLPRTYGVGDPRPLGSTCVNIDACRMRRCCRCSSPPTIRAWRRAARR